jgi:hypothetical protein
VASSTAAPLRNVRVGASCDSPEKAAEDRWQHAGVRGEHTSSPGPTPSVRRARAIASAPAAGPRRAPAGTGPRRLQTLRGQGPRNPFRTAARRTASNQLSRTFRGPRSARPPRRSCAGRVRVSHRRPSPDGSRLASAIPKDRDGSGRRSRILTSDLGGARYSQTKEALNGGTTNHPNSLPAPRDPATLFACHLVRGVSPRGRLRRPHGGMQVATLQRSERRPVELSLCQLWV